MHLHEFHQRAGARMTTVNGIEVPADYGDTLVEHRAMVETAA